MPAPDYPAALAEPGAGFYQGFHQRYHQGSTRFCKRGFHTRVPSGLWLSPGFQQGRPRSPCRTSWNTGGACATLLRTGSAVGGTGGTRPGCRTSVELVEPYFRTAPGHAGNPPQTTPQSLQNFVERWWNLGGTLVEPVPGRSLGTLVEPWWNPGGT